MPRSAAFTRLDLCVVVGVLILLLAVIWPALAGTRAQADRLVCLSNLGEIGKGYNLWATEHGGVYPFILYGPEGGTRYGSYNGLEGNAWFQFAFVSNELHSARILACPSDERRVVEDFSLSTHGLLHPNNRNNSISYFLTYASYDMGRVLSGDRNLQPDAGIGPCGVFGPGNFPTMEPDARTRSWSSRLHQSIGNLLYSDGAAETVGQVGKNEELRMVGNSAHLLIP